MAERLSCIHRGAYTRTLSCGCPSGVKLYACTLLGECALMADGGKRGKAIQEAGVPNCLECKERHARPEKPKIVHDPFPQHDREPLPNLAEQLWREQRKARRRKLLSQRTGESVQ